LAVFPRCSLLTYRFRYDRRSRLEKQPTDLRRIQRDLGDGTLASGGNAVSSKPKDNILLVLKYSSQQLTRVEHQLKPEVAHFEHTQVGLGIAHLETEPVLFVFKTPVTEIQLSVTLNFNFKFVTAGSNEADYSLDDLSLRCVRLSDFLKERSLECWRCVRRERVPSASGSLLSRCCFGNGTSISGSSPPRAGLSV
jgi:hypothetical protein